MKLRVVLASALVACTLPNQANAQIWSDSHSTSYSSSSIQQDNEPAHIVERFEEQHNNDPKIVIQRQINGDDEWTSAQRQHNLQAYGPGGLPPIQLQNDNDSWRAKSTPASTQQHIESMSDEKQVQQQVQDADAAIQARYTRHHPMLMIRRINTPYGMMESISSVDLEDDNDDNNNNELSNSDDFETKIDEEQDDISSNRLAQIRKDPHKRQAKENLRSDRAKRTKIKSQSAASRMFQKRFRKRKNKERALKILKKRKEHAEKLQEACGADKKSESCKLHQAEHKELKEQQKHIYSLLNDKKKAKIEHKLQAAKQARRDAKHEAGIKVRTPQNMETQTDDDGSGMKPPHGGREE
jgi:hypothetical protein